MSVTGLSPTGQRSEELLRSPTLSGGLMVLLVAVGLLDVALIGMAANLGTRPVGSQDCLSKAEGFDAVAMVAVIASITAYLFFFWWLAHRAAQLPRLRVAEQAYSPRVVALTALLPLATGFQLLWTVGELWRSSSTPVDFSDSRSWRRAPAGTLVFLWWVTTMVTGLVCLLWIHSLLTLSTMLEIGEGEVSNHLLITVLTGAIQFIAVGFTMALIQTIDNRQLERFRAIQKRYEATAPVSGAPHAGTAARVPLSASHCTKALGIALAFQALFVLVAVVLALPAWCHLFSTQAILLAVAVTLARSEGVPLSRLAALSKPRSTEIAGGAMVGVGAFALATMWLFPWVEARFALGQDEQPGALEAIPELVVLLPILIVVVAPLVEEILFRGVLFEALSSALPATTVIVLTAAVFAVMHAHPPQIVTTFVLGLHLGLVRALSGSVSGSIVVHLVNNLGALLVLPRFDAAREPLPGDLVLPIAVLLVLGYFLSMSHRIDDLSALISGRGTSDATPASRQMADSLRSTQVKAERAAHFTSPILHALRVQLLGGPLAHGLAVALAIFHSVRYAGGTLLSWRENGSLGLVAAGFFSFWAWCMWQDRKTPSLILLVPFVLMWPLHGLMAQHFGLWELMVMAVFCLGVLAVFREQHILDIVPESLAFWAPTPSTPTEPAEESTTPAGRDGFESGDTIAWHIPASSLDQLALAGSPGDFLGLWSLDLSTLPPQWRRAALAEGVDADGRSIFVIEAQRTEEGVFLRARMSGPDGTGLESRGVAISDAARRLEVDWRQSLPALRDGQLLVSVNGHLICWLVDLDNSRHALWAVRYSSALSLAGHP